MCQLAIHFLQWTCHNRYRDPISQISCVAITTTQSSRVICSSLISTCVLTSAAKGAQKMRIQKMYTYTSILKKVAKFCICHSCTVVPFLTVLTYLSNVLKLLFYQINLKTFLWPFRAILDHFCSFLFICGHFGQF